MTLAEWVCLLMVCEGAYGWAVYHINQACHWIFGHHSPDQQTASHSHNLLMAPPIPFTQQTLSLIILSLFSSLHLIYIHNLIKCFMNLMHNSVTRILFLLIWLTSGLVWDVLRWCMGILQHTAIYSIHQTLIFCARKNSVKTWGILTGRKFNKGIIFYLLERNSQAVWWSLFHFILFRLSW